MLSAKAHYGVMPVPVVAGRAASCRAAPVVARLSEQGGTVKRGNVQRKPLSSAPAPQRSGGPSSGNPFLTAPECVQNMQFAACSRTDASCALRRCSWLLGKPSSGTKSVTAPAKPGAKPAAKPAPKPAAKPAAKPASKPAAAPAKPFFTLPKFPSPPPKAAPKPAPKVAAKPVAKPDGAKSASELLGALQARHGASGG
jgi:hypothetical protein